jgi:hypothetical protein
VSSPQENRAFGDLANFKMNLRAATMRKRKPDPLETSHTARLETKSRAMRARALSVPQVLFFTKIYALLEGGHAHRERHDAKS